MRVLLFSLLLVIPLPLAAAEKCPAPKSVNFVAQDMIRRDVPGFTEGLEVHDDAIYESTGDVFGDSRINRIDPKTGHVTALVNAGKSYFGEGITFFAGKLYQMTWHEHRVFVFGENMRKLAELSNPREGWGLTHDDKELIASDGSSKLFFLSPQDFTTRHTLTVRDGGREVGNINELEYVRGAIWANVFESWTLIRISPITGCVEARADLSPLRAMMTTMDLQAIGADSNFVPNGIAYNPASGQFTVTGKYWPMLFTGRFADVN
ncbi:MAG TPA: glutaminyl-peptide cyclotransferase [Rhizomicrobium sp.]|nr:glutaminyl-peptide cyclotransferase [Rhizomicrobium sp.]